MDLIVNISDCPITGLKRKVDVNDFIWSRRNTQITLECLVYYYENNSGSYGNKIENSRFAPYLRYLYANNYHYINPLTLDTIEAGQYDPEVHVGYVLEYNYWEPFAYEEVVLVDKITEQIVFADANGKFN